MEQKQRDGAKDFQVGRWRKVQFQNAGYFAQGFTTANPGAY